MQTAILQTGRPPEFTPEVIIQAGQELRDAGRNITGFALRQKIGGGNPGRLKQVWNEYLASQSVAKAEPVAELPIEVAEEIAMVTKNLTDRLYLLAVELNDKAVKAAERRVAEVVKAADDQREQVGRELADASSTVDDLEAKMNSARAESAELEIRLIEAQAISQAQAVDLAKLRERLELTEQNAKVAASQHVAELEQLRTALAEQKQVQHSLTAERDNARMETGKVREELAHVSGQLEMMKTQVEQLMKAIGGHPPQTKKPPKNLTSGTKGKEGEND
jgi:chromosome segregation ATPase